MIGRLADETLVSVDALSFVGTGDHSTVAPFVILEFIAECDRATGGPCDTGPFPLLGDRTKLGKALSLSCDARRRAGEISRRLTVFPLGLKGN